MGYLSRRGITVVALSVLFLWAGLYSIQYGGSVSESAAGTYSDVDYRSVGLPRQWLERTDVRQWKIKDAPPDRYHVELSALGFDAGIAFGMAAMLTLLRALAETFRKPRTSWESCVAYAGLAALSGAIGGYLAGLLSLGFKTPMGLVLVLALWAVYLAMLFPAAWVFFRTRQYSVLLLVSTVTWVSETCGVNLSQMTIHQVNLEGVCIHALPFMVVGSCVLITFAAFCFRRLAKAQ